MSTEIQFKYKPGTEGYKGNPILVRPIVMGPAAHRTDGVFHTYQSKQGHNPASGRAKDSPSPASVVDVTALGPKSKTMSMKAVKIVPNDSVF